METSMDHQEFMFEEPAEVSAPETYDEAALTSDVSAEEFSGDVAASEMVSGEENETVTPAVEGSSAGNASSSESTVSAPLTSDDFTALEERILRAVGLVRVERQARAATEERAATLEIQIQAQSPVIEQLQREVESLRAEREQVRQRVERLLSQLDALEL